MFYIMDHLFNWYGIIDQYKTIEINHRYYEKDDATFTLSYDKETANMLQPGRILYRFGTKKGYIIETVEIQKEADEIWIFAVGLESLLERRVINTDTYFEGDPVEALSFGFDFVFSDWDPTLGAALDRSIPNLQNATTQPINQLNGAKVDEVYVGETFLDVVKTFSKSYGIGFRIDFDTTIKKMIFQMYFAAGFGKKPITNILWSSRWGSLENETVLHSNKDHKNVVFARSGDDIPIETIQGNVKGWERIEYFLDMSSLKAGEENTATAIKKSMVSKSKEIITKSKKIRQFDFILSQNVQQKFNIDFFVGDHVKVFHHEYNVTEIQCIEEVKETIKNEISTYEIKFDEGD